MPTPKKEKKFKSPLDSNADKTRINTLKLMPGLLGTISTLSNEYDVSPNLIAYRLSHEGFIDALARYMTETKTNIDIDDNIFDHQVINPFSELGLDDSFDRIKTGKTKLHRYIPFVKDQYTNENNRIVNTANTESIYDNLESFVADIAGRQNRLKNKGYNGEDLIKATNRAFNAGEYSTLPLDNYGLGIYSKLTFPKPKSYKKEYKDNNFKNVFLDDAIKYISDISRNYNYDSEEKAMHNNYSEPEYFLHTPIKNPTSILEYSNVIDNQKEIQNYKKRNFIKRNSTIKIKDDDKFYLGITPLNNRKTLSGNY